MSDSQSEPWSDNSNTQGTPRYAYPVEKAFFAGNLIGSMFYGTYGGIPTHVSVLRADCFVCLVYSRNAHRVILQMHDRFI